MASVLAPPILNTEQRPWKITPNGALSDTPTWTLTSDPSIGQLVVAADGLAAVTIAAAGAVGNITFTVTSSGLTDDGTQPVQAAPPPPATALNLSFGDATPQV